MSNDAGILNATVDLKTHFDGRFDLVEQPRILAAPVPTRVVAAPPAAE